MFHLALAWIVGPLLTLFIVLSEHFLPIDKRYRLNGRKYRLPPGPSGVPIFGNLLQFMRARKTGQLFPWLGSLRRYGSMTTLHLGSQTWIVLNNSDVATDIINKNSKITNERPVMPISGDLVSHGKRAVIRRANDWREGRRVMHHLLSGSVLRKYGAWQELASLQLLSSYLKEPERWYAHHYQYALAVLYRVVFGDTLDKTREELDAFGWIGIEFVATMASSLIDFFPALAKLPNFLQPWRPFWKAMGDHHRAVMAEWWTPVYLRVQDGSANPSFLRDTLLSPQTNFKNGDEEEAMYLAISVITAGSDNTRMNLNTFMMAMIDNPQSFAKARSEIDRICGIKSKRLPDLQDIEQLGYVAAMIKEVLRWRPTVPIVPQHQLTEDFSYNGYVFPKGVSFVINNVALSQEHKDWDTFNPDRWIDSDGTQTNVIRNLWAFGGGRRICVGYRIAQQALFIAMARLIYCFDFVPRGTYDTQTLNHRIQGEPFPVKVVSRGSAYKSLIETELARASLGKEKEAAVASVPVPVPAVDGNKQAGSNHVQVVK